MKNVKVVSRLLFVGASLCLIVACGTSPQQDVADSCKVQVNEDDCVMLGNNMLAFTKGMENFECAWKNGACHMQSIGSATTK
jgi:hypothetical protein